MGDEQRLSAFIERIYEVAHDPGAWATLLPDLSGHLGSHFSTIYTPYLADGSYAGLFHSVGMSDQAIKEYSEYYGSISTNFQILKDYPVGAVFTDQLAPNYDEYLASETFNDWIRPNDADHLLNLILLRGPDRQTSLTLRRNRRLGPFREDEIAQLEYLAPHFVRSARMGQHLRRIEGERNSLEAALERSSDAMIVLDSGGQLVFMNRRCQDIIAQGDGLSLDAKERPRAGVLSESTDLAAAIHAATHGAGNGVWEAGDIVMISRISMRRPYQILVAPLAGEEKVLDQDCAAILIISDPEAGPGTSEQSLRRLYGLTEAEAVFVIVFVEEASLKATAERLSLTNSSARTYLKRVFAKTEVNSQAALMKLILNGSSLPAFD